ncbi:ABC transporter ATP-binding protein [Rossellomorea aquimaris]|uniref:ABC transporter ATP-binding protein n=1 Tax=Rossellomorea aquimaris TaxID=189382 RepID=UPI001CD41362|nr:ABC transporter ATP-binding protein [Rossellomorea aquimaris]MCA1060260.1 ABC transporter ATP-binding protein [Rossellomorea aquimaris]
MIEVKNVSKKFPNGEHQEYVLKDVQFEIKRGELVGIFGKSGSGKSTLLHILSGIDTPTSGTVQIDGSNIASLSNRALTKWRGKHVGIVFQSFHLIPTLTLVENVMLPMEFVNNRKRKRQRALELLEQMGLGMKADKFPASVSGGERQRTAFARALANDPPVIAADEPTGNLDSQTSKEIFKLFQELAESGKTVLFVTHDLDFYEKVSRRLHVEDGSVYEPHSQRV